MPHALLKTYATSGFERAFFKISGGLLTYCTVNHYFAARYFAKTTKRMNETMTQDTTIQSKL
jgi:hypothetical protein